MALQGELARYERAFSRQATVQNAFLKNAQTALAKLPKVAKPAEWSGKDGEEWPLEIAAALAFNGKFDAAENFAQAAQKRRLQIEPNTAESSSWPDELRAAYQNPPMWVPLDAARKAKLQKQMETESNESEKFGPSYRLFFALRFDGKPDQARTILTRALARIPAPVKGENSDRWASIGSKVKL